MAATKKKAGIQVHCAHTKIVAPSSLKPHPKNPNKHPQSQIELLAKIIEYQGWRSPVVVSNRSGFIIKGHGRVEAAKILGTQVPVDYQDYNSDQDELADLIADNRVSELAEMDLDAVHQMMKDDVFKDFDLDMTGFDFFSRADMDEEEEKAAEKAAQPENESESEQLQPALTTGTATGPTQPPEVIGSVPQKQCCPRCGYLIERA